MALLVAGCDAPPAPPVVHQVPVFTRPYEEGYSAGFIAGKASAKPRTRMPSEEEARKCSVDAAAGDPARNEKWQHGWAEGYMDGFREVKLNRR
jgi:hypothetical protein